MKIHLSAKTTLPAVLALVAVLLFVSPAVGSPPPPAVVLTPAPITAVSETPGATLLVPYFEVDLSNPNGRNTIFTINNVGPTNGPALTRVTIWSDLGVPVFGFNVYLTGFDVETINMRTVLGGTLPQTASAGQDGGDTISPKGTASQDINFGTCTGALPPAALNAGQISDLVNALTGNAVAGQGGKCGGRNLGDNVARGYITVDNVVACFPLNPGDAGYFGVIPSDNNVLTGEVFYVNPSTSTMTGGNAVHIHASATDPLVTNMGNYTFYGRLDMFSAVDHRQPLSTVFTPRFNAGILNGNNASPFRRIPSSSLIVWRDIKVPQTYFTCGVLPTWYPLGQENITAFDEQEHSQTITGQKPFPAATQLVGTGGTSLPITFGAGFLVLNLNTTVAGTLGPTGDLGAAQAWVQIIDGLNPFLHNAPQLDSATKAAHFTP